MLHNLLSPLPNIALALLLQWKIEVLAKKHLAIMQHKYFMYNLKRNFYSILFDSNQYSDVDVLEHKLERKKKDWGSLPRLCRMNY